MSLLMEADGLDSTQKGETAIRVIDWITLVGRHLNQTREELQVGAVEHFARVAKFQAEVVSTVHMLCMLKVSTHNGKTSHYNWERSLADWAHCNDR